MTVQALAQCARAGTQLIQDSTASVVEGKARAHVSHAQSAVTDSTSKAV